MLHCVFQKCQDVIPTGVHREDIGNPSDSHFGIGFSTPPKRIPKKVGIDFVYRTFRGTHLPTFCFSCVPHVLRLMPLMRPRFRKKQSTPDLGAKDRIVILSKNDLKNEQNGKYQNISQENWGYFDIFNGYHGDTLHYNS